MWLLILTFAKIHGLTCARAVGIVSVPKRSALETSCRELTEDVSRSVLAPSWLSSNRAWKTTPGGSDVHRHRIRYPTEHSGKARYGLNTLRTPRWGSVRSQYPTQHSGKVRYGLITLPNIPARFGTNSTPVPDTSISSVRAQKIPRVVYPTKTCTLLRV